MNDTLHFNFKLYFEMAMGFKPTQLTQRFCRPPRLFHFGEPSDLNMSNKQWILSNFFTAYYSKKTKSVPIFCLNFCARQTLFLPKIY